MSPLMIRTLQIGCERLALLLKRACPSFLSTEMSFLRSPFLTLWENAAVAKTLRDIFLTLTGTASQFRNGLSE